MLFLVHIYTDIQPPTKKKKREDRHFERNYFINVNCAYDLTIQRTQKVPEKKNKNIPISDRSSKEIFSFAPIFGGEKVKVKNILYIYFC